MNEIDSTSTSPPPPNARRYGWRETWWWRLPVIFAVLVACSQIFLAHTENLNPAKGGGFGLFSTVDKLENRNLRAYLITKVHGEIPFAIPQTVDYEENLRKPIYRAASMPTDHFMQVILDDLVTKPYDTRVAPEAIRVEVWKLVFDPATLKTRREKIAEKTARMERP